MFADLDFSNLLFEVRAFHLLELQVELFSGEQAAH
jgi:hypothetical protein